MMSEGLGRRIKSYTGIFAVIVSVINLLMVVVIYRQVRNNQIRFQEEWAAELIKTIYETEECSIPPCPPNASPRSREEAVKIYVGIERKQGRAAKLQQANLAGLTLSHLNLSGVDLSGANLQAATLREARLSKADLSNANLFHADLRGADLSGANLAAAMFHAADLTGAMVVGAVLKEAKLGECAEGQFSLGTGESYKGAVLTNADLDRAELENSSMCGVDFSGAKLAGAIHLTQAQIDSAKGNRLTTLPAHLGRPKHWMNARNR
jgi:hypothetical protein